MQIEGASSVNGIDLRERDALETVGEDLVIRAEETSHLLVVEMAA